MLVDIDKIIVSDRIRKDFGNIEELAKDIQENGLINPPVVTPQLQLIAGERRLRACKHLGWKQIEVRVVTVRDYEHQLRMEISENENRKEFTFSERVDWARRLERIEKEKARQRMEAGKTIDPVQNFAEGRSRDIVAEVSGFGSGEQYRKAKFIAEHGDEELIARLDAGEISIHKAYTELKKRLKEEEEARLQAEQRASEAESRLADVLSQSEKEIQELKEQLQRAKEEIRVEEVIKEVPSKELLDKVSELESKLQEELKKQNDLKTELRKKDEELLALTRAQLQQKNRYIVQDTLSALIQAVGKYMREAQLKITERDLYGDKETYQSIMSCAEVLEKAAKEMRGWFECGSESKRKGEIVDGEFSIVT